VWRWAPLLSAASSCCDAMFLLICLAAGAQLVACHGLVYFSGTCSALWL